MSDLVEHLRAMARNNRWANHRLHGACAELSPAQLSAPRIGFFPSIAATLEHILVVDDYYIDAVKEAGVGKAVYDNFETGRATAELSDAQRQSDLRLIRFCDCLSDNDPARVVTTDRAIEGKVNETIGALLAHLFQHQIHHRGQVHAMLSGTSVKPPQLDDFFLNHARAQDIEVALADF